jgi:hypothetical protein
MFRFLGELIVLKTNRLGMKPTGLAGDGFFPLQRRYRDLSWFCAGVIVLNIAMIQEVGNRSEPR